MKVLRNDPVDTMTSTAKKVMTSFKNKQNQWEQNIPFGKKKETKTKKSRDTPVLATAPNIRSNFAPRRDTGGVSEEVAKAAKIMPKLDKSELSDLPMASAKPSEIAKAAKQQRKAYEAETRAAKERQRKAAEQQMKMNRYRDEIAAIKKKQENEERKSKKGRGRNSVAQDALQKVLTKEVTEEDENAVLGYTEEDCQSDDGSDYEAPVKVNSQKFQSKNIRRKNMLDDLKGSFHSAMNLVKDIPKTPKNKKNKVNINSAALSMEPPRQREYEADKKGRLRQAPRKGSTTLLGPRKKRAAPPAKKKSVTLVPEMRRRPNQADLLHAAPDPTITETSNGKNYKGTQWNKEKLINDKQQKEKQQLEEQKKKLDEAEEAFKKGHNLCWQIQDSSAALQEYRTALFIRESLLGKYHEQTGRTYFWIGKSLVKLDEFSEALVAFSRSLRIFDRVVRKEHKYYKWTITGIDECIEKMEDPNFKTDGYKGRLHASIQFELDGDKFRKQGKMPEAIAKYRDAIGKFAFGM